MTADPSARAPSWTTLAGVATFVALMGAGYAYNVTFVQLGVTDLGRRIVGLDDRAVAGAMEVLALVTAGVALALGFAMVRAGRVRGLRSKLRLTALAVAVQTLATFVAPLVASHAAYLAWLVVTAVALGVAVPATFALTVDLVPVRLRGAAAAGVTAIAYAIAPLLSIGVTVEALAIPIGVLMVLGTLALAAFAWLDVPIVDAWARQGAQPSFAEGRYVRRDADGRVRVRRRMLTVLALLFVVFFVDSLGFLRLVDTPLYVVQTWGAADLGPRIAIAVSHVIAALIGGVLYGALGERALIAWVLGIFAVVHLGYQLDARSGLGDGASLGMPVLYAVAVSLYTVVTFAVWADLSTPRTIGLHAALGVAASAWTATFLATGLALRWAEAGVTFERHVSLVNAFATPALVALVLTMVWPRRRPEAVAP
jgi:MFS family permease